MIKQLEPVEVVRDQEGHWWHPVYVDYWNKCIGESMESCSDDQWEKLEDDLGVVFRFIDLPFDESNFYFDMATITDQEIESLKPSGDGWFIAFICDGNEGPVAAWAKPRLPGEVVKSLAEVV